MVGIVDSENIYLILNRINYLCTYGLCDTILEKGY